MHVPVVVFTSDRYLWAIQPFSYLFNIYWSTFQPVTVVGFSHPDFRLPNNFRFYSIPGAPLPADRWSDGCAYFLRVLPEKWFVLMLEDYWLVRTVDTQAVVTLAEYLTMHQDVLRLDLTTDRLYAGGMTDVESWGHYDIVETPAGTPYQMSLQAAIWNRDLFLQLLQPGKSPWEVETQTSPPPEMRVLGTRQNPVRYVNAFKGGNPNLLLNLEGIPEEHILEMGRRGWLSR